MRKALTFLCWAGGRVNEKSRLRMRRYRPLFLLLVLLVLLIGFYLYTSSSVRVETVKLESHLVGKTLEYSVLLPPNYALITSRKKHYPVLYLLHGWNGNPQGWLTQTKLTEYAARYRLIIVLPEGDNGWYTDSATVATDKYESYILQELIPDVESRFRAISDRGGRAIAGLSMGGYGALKFGLKRPELFSFAASMSGALDAPARTDDVSIMRTFGDADNPTRAGNDLFRLVNSLPAERVTALPDFYLNCGTEDPWLKVNRDLANIFSERKIAHQYEEFPGGHDWQYWDKQVQKILNLAAQKLSPAE
jgi:putative tributyrin esterase